MKAIWSALDQPGRNWRSVFKALTLLDHLVKNGAERVVEEVSFYILFPIFFPPSLISSLPAPDQPGRNWRSVFKALTSLDLRTSKTVNERASSRRKTKTHPSFPPSLPP